jgi:methyl-accepting chemotaxis protein
MAAEDNVMQIEIEKPKINPVHFSAIIAGALVNAFILGGVWISLNRDVGDLRDKQIEMSKRFDVEADDRKDRQKSYQTAMDGMNTQIGQIQPLQFQQSRMLEQITENKTSVAEVGKRIDRVVESFGGKLDQVIDNVGKVATQVQVLSSKFDDSQGRANKSAYRMPIVRP